MKNAVRGRHGERRRAGDRGGRRLRASTSGQGRAARRAAPGDGSDLGAHGGGEGRQGNQVSSMVVSVASNIADPLERLKAVPRVDASGRRSSRAPSARGHSPTTRSSSPAGSPRLASRTAARFEMANRVDPAAQHRHHERARAAGAAVLRRRQDRDDVRHGPDQRRHGLMHPVTARRRARHRRHVVSGDAARPGRLRGMPQDSYDELAEATVARRRRRSGAPDAERLPPLRAAS